MADGWLYDQDGSGTLRVPFVFIPEGVAQPLDWLVEHPNHIRVPAKFVPAKQPPPTHAPGAGRSSRGMSSSTNHAAPTAEYVSGYAPIGPHQRRYPPPPQIDRSGYFQESPIAAYLRINKMFDRLKIGSSPRMASGARLAANVSNPETSPRCAPDVPSQSRLASGDTARSASTVDPTAPVDLRDGRGSPVVSDRTRQPILRPAGLAPEFFIQKGLEDREAMEQLMRHSEEGGGGAVTALIYEKDVLRNFRQYGVWDAQRIGGKQHKTFQDYSTIAIGIYAAAAGIPEPEILIIQDFYAWRHSSFSPGTVFDRTYRHLPEDNVKNAHLGYVLYESYQTRMDSKR